MYFKSIIFNELIAFFHYYIYTMNNTFSNLTDDEREAMMKIPFLVSILIAGADDDIDKAEIRRAVELFYIKEAKQEQEDAELIDYYRSVGEDFEDKLKVLIQQYPLIASERNPMIITELEKLNTILPKLEPRFAVDFYASIRILARKIAEASGGVLGYMAVGYEESKLMDLEMIKDPSV